MFNGLNVLFLAISSMTVLVQNPRATFLLTRLGKRRHVRQVQWQYGWQAQWQYRWQAQWQYGWQAQAGAVAVRAASAVAVRAAGAVAVRAAGGQGNRRRL